MTGSPSPAFFNKGKGRMKNNREIVRTTILAVLLFTTVAGLVAYNVTVSQSSTSVHAALIETGLISVGATFAAGVVVWTAIKLAMAGMLLYLGFRNAGIRPILFALTAVVLAVTWFSLLRHFGEAWGDTGKIFDLVFAVSITTCIIMAGATQPGNKTNVS